MNRIWLRLMLGTMVAALLAPAVADAQVRRVSRGDSRHAFGFGLGYFALRGLDSRVDNDVLLVDIQDQGLFFDVKDFNGALVEGEWLVGVSDFLEAGVGVGFYQRTVPSIYRDLTKATGEEIDQDLKLRDVPFVATVRFLPIGRGAAVEPYIGVGVGVHRWRYSEVGEFIDENDFTFSARYIANGTAVGPVILGGLRAPVGDVWDIGGEIRWQRAEGDIETFSWLPGGKIDLGGITASFKVHLRF